MSTNRKVLSSVDLPHQAYGCCHLLSSILTGDVAEVESGKRASVVAVYRPTSTNAHSAFCFSVSSRRRRRRPPFSSKAYAMGNFIDWPIDSARDTTVGQIIDMLNDRDFCSSNLLVHLSVVETVDAFTAHEISRCTCYGAFRSSSVL